jgi:DNA replication protein DnaC
VAPRTCPIGVCDGSGLIVDEATRTSRYCGCREQVVSAARARGLSAVIPKKYRGVSFDRAPVTQIDVRTVSVVRGYASGLQRNLDEGRGLWMFGPHGTGKTTLAMVVSKAALDAGRSVAIYSLPRLLADIRRTFDDGSDMTQTELIDRLAAVDLLHLDDVGAEQTSDWVLEQLYAIVNARYEAEKAIVVTTNLTEAEELAQQVGMRTVSRLEEMCTILPVLGSDMRRQTFGVEPEEFDGEPQARALRWDVA